jgi:rfaE bifunctional protein kinase chain/domain
MEERVDPTDVRYVLVTGRFNVLHPGHIRLFQFARLLGDRLIAAVESDRLAGNAAHVKDELRLEGVRNCSLVDEAFIFDEGVGSLISRLRPKVVVKGREHEQGFNPEAEAVAAYGGQLIFSSGEIQFSSTDLLRQEFLSSASPSISPPESFMARHAISAARLNKLTTEFAKLRVLTIGDLIIDDYINCEPLGMSQEDPTLVVSPIDKRRFIGGAGIVAAHAAGLGAESHLVCVGGGDAAHEFGLQALTKANVCASILQDFSRPTTLKERYRSHGKTLLRVSHLHQSAISIGLQTRIIEQVKQRIASADLLIFSDFNYGVLTQAVVDEVIALARASGVIVAADSQSSSQLGDIGRFKGVDLLMPTEREARISTQNREDGLVILAEQLHRKSYAKFILLKMGEDGVLIHAPSEASSGWLTDQVEALNKFSKDVAGAGDSMLVSSALTLAAGGTIWEAACIGSMAAAVQVGRVGNMPLNLKELTGLLDNVNHESSKFKVS